MELELKDGFENLSLDSLFQEEVEEQAASSTAIEGDQAEGDKSIDLTKAMTKRINDVKTKTTETVREDIAKQLGFNSYEEMIKAKNEQAIIEAGYKPEDLQPLIEQAVKDKLEHDPRLQELEQIKALQKESAMSAELAEIEKLTGVKLTTATIPQETLDLYAKGGITLKQAYLATNYDKLLAGSKGSTVHLATGAGAGTTQTRGLSAREKEIYRSINPDITDEELNKKTISQTK